MGARRDSSLLAVAQNDRGGAQADVALRVILRERGDRRIWGRRGNVEFVLSKSFPSALICTNGIHVPHLHEHSTSYEGFDRSSCSPT